MKVKQFFADFKAFALKGNIMDMAVGVVIGGAFSKIVTALVNDIITPLIALITGEATLTDLKWVIRAAVTQNGVEVTPEVAVLYGNFLQTVMDFLIIAFSIFLILRLMMGAQKKLELLKKKEIEEAKAEEAAPADTELSLLTEIRDLMKAKESESDI